MSTPPRADPAIYRKLRDRMLQTKQPGFEPAAVQSVSMDWHVGNGTATVFAAADGTASIYLSSGGGYLGGGQKYPAIRDAAQQAVRLATDLIPQFKPTESFNLPAAGEVFFYLTTSKDVRLAIVQEADLKMGKDPFLALGGIMQTIITQYRLNSPPPAAK
jgi:hypothetical protein